MSLSASTDRFVDDYLLSLLARASFQVSRQFHDVVRQAGLRVPEWRVLATLDGGPATIGELAAITLVQQPTLTKVIDRMERGGLVCRRRDPDDRRRVLVAATDKGRETVAALLQAARTHEASVLAAYDPNEADALKLALRTLIQRTDAA